MYCCSDGTRAGDNTPRAISARGRWGRPGQGCYANAQGCYARTVVPRTPAGNTRTAGRLSPRIPASNARTVVPCTPICHRRSFRVCGRKGALHKSAMEDWGDDMIESCIAHLRSLHVVPQRSADSVDTGASARVPRPARKCAKVIGKPAHSAVCTFGPDPPGCSWHLESTRTRIAPDACMPGTGPVGNGALGWGPSGCRILGCK